MGWTVRAVGGEGREPVRALEAPDEESLVWVGPERGSGVGGGGRESSADRAASQA